MRKLFLIGWLVVVAVLRAEAQTCSGTRTLTEPSGTFDDGSGRRQYSNNLDCRWLIQPPGARILRLQFLEFMTEPEADVVTIYDGPTTESPILGQFSGFMRDEILFTTQGTALVRFVTNSRGTDEGWMLSYRSLDELPTCEGQQSFFEPAGSIELGGPYTANLDCEWLLFNPIGGLAPVRLDFDRFRTEEGRDVVEIYNGFDRESPLVASFSGTRLPDVLEFEAEAVLIVFRSDEQNSDEGWRLNYRWEMPEPTCEGQTRLTESEGVFDDGSGPDRPYTGSLYCEWLIEPAVPARYLRLDFEDFDVDFGATVSVYDGLAPDAPLLQVFNSFSPPEGPLFTTQGTARVLFSSLGQGGIGWTLRYRSVDERPTCSGRQQLFEPEGTIEDGSGPANYSDNLDCRWQLLNPVWMQGLLRIEFDEFRTQARRDVVEIYNGFDTESPLIASFSGTTLPEVLEFPTMAALIVFRTDESINDAGWRLRYRWLEPEPTCKGQTRLTAPSGSFDDGSGPDRDFTSGLDCEWLIEPTPPARFLRLEFTDFDLGFMSEGLITIYDGPTRDSEIIGVYPPGQRPAPVFTSGGAALVVFQNRSGFGPGWTLRYESVQNRPTCSGRQIVTDVSGTIEDGSGPDRDYDNDLDCEWLLLSPTGEPQPLRIDFEQLDIDIILDALTIHEGVGRNGRMLGVYTGNRLPPPLEVEADAVTLLFRTNRMRTAAGWRLRYTWPEPDPSCSGRQTLTQSQGFVADKERDGFYTNNLECEWLIAPPGASSLNLQFDFFETHSAADYVDIYRGDQPLEANRLLRHSGRRLPEPLLVPEGVALVRFVTDGSGVAQGWLLNYEAGGTARGQLVPQHAPLLVYPNPATDHCILHWPAGEAARLTVVDAAGRVVASQRVETSAVELDIAAWARGLYALRLETASGRLYTGRLLKP